jgi:outer membrane immunogenic protein
MRLSLAGFIVGAVSLAAAQGAFAADMPVKAYNHPAVYNWTGCYLGANVGAAKSRTRVIDESSFIALAGTEVANHSPTSIVGGGQIGCDYQFAPTWVVGVRGMWDFADLNGSGSNANGSSNTVSSKMTSFGTLTARLGYLINPSLLAYVNGGFAWTRSNLSTACATGFCAATPSTVSDNRSGGVAGLGAAWMVAPRWELFVEYNHMWLGTKTVDFYGPGLFTADVKRNLDVVMLGVNYRFPMR